MSASGMTDPMAGVAEAAELSAEVAEARRSLEDLHARRAALVAGDGDSMALSEIRVVDSMITAAETRLSESAADDLATAYVWGVDPAVSRLAVAFAEVGSEAITVETLSTASEAREGERLGLLDRQTRIFARQFAGSYPPAVVWVEQPSGRHINLPLTYATGVVQAALFETLGCPVWTVASAAWKVRTVGSGNATKAQVKAWVLEQGVVVGSQDECDAYCMAAAGRAMLAAGDWMATA